MSSVLLPDGADMLPCDGGGRDDRQTSVADDPDEQ